MDETDLRKKVGNPDQIAFAQRVVMSDGPESGLKLILVDNGAGLTLQLLENRCLDIAKLSYKGKNLSFLSKPGLVGPDQIFPKNGEFVRYFQGGMLYTCGLQNVGPASADEGKEHLLHGRLGITPARLTSQIVDFDRGEILLAGTVSQAELFGPNLVLERKITIPLFGNKVVIDDQVRNLGFSPEHVLLLYHFNFGWPMLSDKTTLAVDGKVEPRDEAAKAGLSRWNVMESPADSYPEQVFYHTPEAGPDHLAHAAVFNPEIGLNVDLSFDPRQLPHLIEWKSMQCGDYALGIEPSTSRVDGRKNEIANHRTVLLPPGESRSFHLELNITER